MSIQMQTTSKYGERLRGKSAVVIWIYYVIFSWSGQNIAQTTNRNIINNYHIVYKIVI